MCVCVHVLTQVSDKTAENDSKVHENQPEMKKKKKKEEAKKEAIEGTWTRVQCEDTKRVLPAEKRAMKEAE